MAAAAPPNHAQLLLMNTEQLREEAQKLTRQIEKLSLQLKTCPEKRQQYIDRKAQLEATRSWITDRIESLQS